MYGVVGERLTQENWSDLLANQRRIIRYLSAMAHSVKENRQNRVLSLFSEDLTQFFHQVSTACTAICSILQSSKTLEKVADELPVLEVHLQAIINRLEQIRIKKKLKGHILEDIIQFYNLLEIITNFTQELDGLIVKLRTREKSTPLLASRWSFKSLPLPVKQIKHIIKTGVAVGLTAAITNFTHQPFGYYATIAVVITMQPTLGKSIDAGKQRAIGTGIGAIIAFIIVNTIGSSPLAVGLGVGFTILTCSYYGFSQGYKPGCFLVAISIMVYGTEPNNYIWKRFTETLLGIVVAQLVSRLFWPETDSHNLDQSISQTLIRIGKLYELTVNQYLQGLNSKAEIERLAKEIRQSIQTHSLLQAESKLEPVNNLTASKTQRKWNFLISYEQTLFDNILSLHDAAEKGNSRGFVHNFVDELQSLEEAIIQAFNELAAALERESQREFPLVLQPLDMIVQKIEQLRVTETSLEYPLNDIIIFLGVLSSMKEVAENLNQMATDWPVVL